jgi:hypothetical protein
MGGFETFAGTRRIDEDADSSDSLAAYHAAAVDP